MGEPGNFQDGGSVFASNTDLELWTEEVEQGVIDNMIVFQKPFPGAARTELESQLQRAVKVSAKGKHVKCKMDLERCLFWDPAAAPRGVGPCGAPGTCGGWAGSGACYLRRAASYWSPWRRRAARSRPPPAARSLWPVRRPRTGGAA